MMIWKPSILQLSENVHQINIGATSVVLIENVEGPILVDAGFKWSAKTLKASLNLFDYELTDICALLMTHFHPDHTGGASVLVENGVKETAIHKLDAPIVSGKQSMPALMAIPVLKLITNPAMKYLVGNPVEPTTLLQGGEILEFPIPINVIHTPGHTLGSVCYHLPTEGVLIAGDALSRRFNRLSGPSKVWSQDWAQGINSLHQLTEFDYDVVCLSHFRPVMENGKKVVKDLVDALQ